MTTVPQAGNARLEVSATPPSLFISGDWTQPHYPALAREVSELRARLDAGTQVVLDGLGALDTAGAALLAELLGAERLLSLASSAPGLATARRALLQTVGSALTEY
ncbi:MAG: ABC transporter permease, partial [Pseudomonas sp.]